MAFGLNKAEVIGRLGADVTINHLAFGGRVANRLGPGITLAAAAPTTDGSESLATDTSGIVIPSQGRKGLKSRNLESEPGWPPGS